MEFICERHWQFARYWWCYSTTCPQWGSDWRPQLTVSVDNLWWCQDITCDIRKSILWYWQEATLLVVSKFNNCDCVKSHSGSIRKQLYMSLVRQKPMAVSGSNLWQCQEATCDSIWHFQEATYVSSRWLGVAHKAGDLGEQGKWLDQVKRRL